MAIVGRNSKVELLAPSKPTSSCVVATAHTSQLCGRDCNSSRQMVSAATEARLSSEWPDKVSPLSSTGGCANETTSPTRTSFATWRGSRPVSTSRCSNATGPSFSSSGRSGAEGWAITPGNGEPPVGYTVTGVPGRTRASTPPISLTRRKPSVIPLTIRPMASMCAATMTEGRGAGPVPCRRPCSEPSLPRLISLTSGRHLSSIIFAAGSS